MNGQQIVSTSTIGQISDEIKFLDGRTMADYKTMLVTLTDKAIAMIPSAVKQAGKEDAKIGLDEMFRKAVRQSWKGDAQYWTTMQSGSTGLTVISKEQIGDIVRMLCNIIDQA
jgi:hypothetical protein